MISGDPYVEMSCASFQIPIWHLSESGQSRPRRPEHNAKHCIFSKSPNSFTSTTLPACIPSPAASSRALKQRRPRPVRESPPVPLFRAGWLRAGSWNKTGHIRKLPMGSCSSQVAADATSIKQADIPTQRKSSAKVRPAFLP